MSSLESLSIQGIRSFSPNDIEQIKFQTPLTLIVGANGSGKTTIIECLKYATTGDMPPITKGSGFITDPQFYNVTTVNAMVKLNFKNLYNNLVITRNSSLTLDTTSNKLNFKSTTKTLEAKDLTTNKKITHEPSKTVAIEDILSKYVGVSKPILDYVIFAHQEDSLWPLSDSNTLKKRFDEIFEVSRFTKELQNLNQIRKGIKVDIKLRESDLSNAQSNLKKSQVIQQRVTELKKKLSLYLNEKGQLEIKLKEIAEAQQDLMNINESYMSIINEYEKLKDEKTNLINLLQKMAKQCPRILNNESKSVLNEQSDFLQKDSIQLQTDLNGKYLENVDSLNTNLEKLLSELNILNIEKGSFLQAKKNYSEYKEEVSNLIENMRLKYDSFDINSPNDLKNILNEKKQSLDSLKESVALKNSSFQSEINELKNEIKNLNSNYIHSKLASSNVKCEITLVEKKLANVKDNELIKHGTSIESLKDSKTMIIQQIHSNCSLDKITNLDSEIKNKEKRIPLLEKELRKIRDQILNAKESSKSTTLYNLKKQEFVPIFNKFKESWTEILIELTKSNSFLSESAKQLFTKLEFFIKEDINESNFEFKNEEFKSNLSIILLDFLDNLIDLKSTLSFEARECEVVGNKSSQQKKTYESEIENFDNLLSENINETLKLKKKISEVMDLSEYDDNNSGTKKYSFDQISIDFGKYFETVKENLVDATEALNLHTGIIKVYEHAKKSITRKNCCSMCNTSFSEDPEKLSNAVEYLNKKINTDIKTLENEKNQCQKEYDSYASIERDVTRFIELQNDYFKKSSQLKNCQEQYAHFMKSYKDIFEKEATIKDKVKTIDGVYNFAIILKNDFSIFKDSLNTLSETSALLKNQSNKKNINSLDIDALAKLQNVKEDQKKQLTTSINELTIKKHEIKNLKTTLENDIQKIDHKMTTLQRLEEELFYLNKQFTNKTSEFNLQLRNSNYCSNMIKTKTVELDELTNKYQNFENISKNDIKSSETYLEQISESFSRLNDFLLPEIKKFETSHINGFDIISNKIMQLEKKIQEKKNEIKKENQFIDKEKERLNLIQKELNDIKICQEHLELKNDLSRIINKLENINYNEVLDYKKEYVVTAQQLNSAFTDITSEISSKKGEIKQIQLQINTDNNTLSNDYKNIQEVFHEINCNSKTLLNIERDLDVASKVIETSIMQFHKTKMEEINVLLDELWRTTYKGSDIATIKIVTEKITNNQGVQSYNYKVVMYKDSLEIDMRGRCSAGQKVMACVLIRLALAETFGVACGVITLDEPTTNLDEENSEGLAESLHRIIESRRFQQNFQIVIITHDENFLRFMNAQDFTDGFWRVKKDNNLASKIEWVDIDKLM